MIQTLVLEVASPSVRTHGELPVHGDYDEAVEPYERPSYSWNSSGDEAGRLMTVVTWTLTPAKGGTLVRMEQSGFRPEDEGNYRGAAYGWRKFIDGLERVAAGLV